jgi:hypothetical protein
MGSLPCIVIGSSPKSEVDRRTGIGEQRNGFICPNAMIYQGISPVFDLPEIVEWGGDKICLNERHMLLGKYQAICDFFEAEHAVLVQHPAPLFRDALDACLNGDTTCTSEELDHLAAP